MKIFRNKARSSPWLDVLLAIFSAVLGLFAGSLLQAIAPPLFQVSNLPYIAFALISVMFLLNVVYSVTLWRSTREQVTRISDYTGDLAIAIGHRVKTVSYEQGYKELQKRIRAAEKEVLILTQYMNIFDWEHGKQLWDSGRLNNPQRKAFFATLRAKLDSEKGKGTLKFVQIVQIPGVHKLEEMLVHDPIYADNCKFVVSITKAEPEFASLRVSRMAFSNSVILIDGEFAHISFDIHNISDSEVDAPFVMLIDDPKSDALQNLIRLYRRIEANSSLVTHIN
jgi:hypothetical protein